MKSSASENEYWNLMSEGTLTDDEVQLFREQLNWNILSAKAKLPNITWTKHRDKIEHQNFAVNTRVPAIVYSALSKDVNWEMVATYREVDNRFLRMVSGRFPTLTFVSKNESAKKISDETWDYVLEKNGHMLETKRGIQKTMFLHKQLISMEALESSKAAWDVLDWKEISKNQKVTTQFIKQNIASIHTRIIEENNKRHELSDIGIEYMRELATKYIEDRIEKDESFSLKQMDEQYIFTEDFYEKYKEEFEQVRNPHEWLKRVDVKKEDITFHTI